MHQARGNLQPLDRGLNYSAGTCRSGFARRRWRVKLALPVRLNHSSATVASVPAANIRTPIGRLKGRDLPKRKRQAPDDFTCPMALAYTHGYSLASVAYADCIMIPRRSYHRASPVEEGSGSMWS